jgi:hypothetical protein
MTVGLLCGTSAGNDRTPLTISLVTNNGDSEAPGMPTTWGWARRRYLYFWTDNSPCRRLQSNAAADRITLKRLGCSAEQYRTVAGKRSERLTGPMRDSFKPRCDAESELEKEEL